MNSRLKLTRTDRKLTDLECEKLRVFAAMLMTRATRIAEMADDRSLVFDDVASRWLEFNLDLPRPPLVDVFQEEEG